MRLEENSHTLGDLHSARPAQDWRVKLGVYRMTGHIAPQAGNVLHAAWQVSLVSGSLILTLVSPWLAAEVEEDAHAAPRGLALEEVAEARPAQPDQGYPNPLVDDCYQRTLEALKLANPEFEDIVLCERALESVGRDASGLVSVLVNRGALYAALDRVDRALEDYNQALEIDTGLAEAYLNRGNLRYAAGDFEQALADYGQAQQLGLLQHHLLLLNRGMALEQLDRLQEAEQAYQASLEKAPGWGLATERLTRLTLQIDQHETTDGTGEQPMKPAPEASRDSDRGLSSDLPI